MNCQMLLGFYANLQTSGYNKKFFLHLYYLIFISIFKGLFVVAKTIISLPIYIIGRYYRRCV